MNEEQFQNWLGGTVKVMSLVPRLLLRPGAFHWVLTKNLLFLEGRDAYEY